MAGRCRCPGAGRGAQPFGPFWPLSLDLTGPGRHFWAVRTSQENSEGGCRQGAFVPVDVRSHLFLVGCGFITIVPLLLFITAARIIPLFMLGFLQYLTPTLFFLLGVFVFKEPFTGEYLLAFALIWAGIIVYSISARTTGQSRTKRAN